MSDEQSARPAAEEPASSQAWARLDLQRARRTGDPEVVFGSGKTPDQIVALLRRLHRAHPGRAALATRLAPEAREVIRAELPNAVIDDIAATATLGPLPSPVGTVAVIAAGTSDQWVAAEAEVTIRCFGSTPVRINDVGVAGLHRLLEAKPEFDEADVLVVVAGMEGALPSVVAGLTGTPLVAVPTSVGYGASFGGMAALLAMLNSCAPGVVVTNIDGGFTAGVHAARIARRTGRHPGDRP